MPRDKTTALLIGVHLRAARKQAGLTQEQAAKRVGGTANQSTIANWEGGRYTPTIPKAFALADAYGITLDELLGHTKEGT